MDYKQQIKSPIWQKKRLEILSRDNFTCQSCGSEDETLHVHHIKYIKGKKYWDYPDRLLITLCEECHGVEHLCKDELVIEAIRNINRSGITYIEILGILDHANELLSGDLNTKPKTVSDVFNSDDISAYTIGDIKRLSEWRKAIK